MTNPAIAVRMSPAAHTVDLEAAAPGNRQTQALSHGNWRTSMKLAAVGLGCVGAATCLAVGLANDMAAQPQNAHDRSLLEENDGCKPGEYRATFSDETKNRYKWAFIGQASVVGLGLVALPLACIGSSESKIKLALLIPTAVMSGLALSGLLITGIAYGVGTINAGKCIEKNP
ncbi:MAG TPA: hypothetical protein VFV39_11670 [Limnobacter sp.]|nr:hypothetical protein [Limnobacter sp.]